jgi:hypothetical protein
MNELTIRTNDLPVFANKELNAATKKIVTIGTKIKKNLFEIALILAKVSENECFKDDGFKSAADYAMKTFGFKKTAAYSLLTIGKEYTAPTLESNLPHEPNEDFTTTQIEKMLPLKDRAVVVELIESGEITPDMSCKEIEAVVKAKTKKDEPADETPETDEPAAPEEETAPVEIVLDFATACNDIRTILDNATPEDFNKYYRGFLDLLGEYNNRK